MGFEKATKKQTKLRLAISGPSGCGKTYSALRIASGMGGKIAFICTENGSARKYADIFNFDVVDLSDKSIPAYSEEIKNAAGYDILIIDSLSHAWQSVLDFVDKLANTKYKNNSYAAWNEGKPLHNNFMQLILSSPCHIIATMRAKMEYVLEENSKGRMSPTKVGLSPIQDKELPYEFDITMIGNQNHDFIIDKDRTGKFQDKLIEKPGEDFGIALAEWLEDGEPPKPKEMTKEEIEKAKAAFEKALAAADTYDKLQELSDRVYGKDLPIEIEQEMLNEISNKDKLLKAKE